MIGIDIGSKFIKVCKIVDTGKKEKEFSAYSAMQSISGLEEVSKVQILSAMLKKLGIEKESSFLAVGGKDLVNRDVVLPSNHVGSRDIKSVIINEASNSISEDLSSMFISYGIIKNLEKETNIIFSAVPKSKVISKLSVLNHIKDIEVRGVTMEAFALANAFEYFGPSYRNTESIVLINIGYVTSNIIVLNNKELVFVKDIDFGGQDITKNIASSYMIPEKLAEEIKRKDDLKRQINFNMKNILKRAASSLIETIFRTIEYCITRQYIISVDRIVITGGGALTDGIDTFIEETLGIPVDKWNPLADNKFVGYTNKDYGYFMPVSLGLALEKEQK